MREMKLQDLKAKTPAELVSFAEELEVENASTMRKQELMFGILKQLSMRETDIIGKGASQGQLRQSHAPLSRGAVADGARRRDQKGSIPACHRYRRTDRQRPAR